MEGNPTYLTLKEASARLGVHPNTLRNWEQRGLVRLARLPGSRYRRVPESEVERLASKMETGLPDISSDRWVRSGKVLILLPPPDDPELRALAEAMAEEVQAELAKVEPQGTLEEAMRELRGWSWS
ncbi:MAG: MerR family DNA-binding transcriptional regulator [Chloroflexi bacterium]|nr:MerR family DNA-binding transcriptional regulator [Chloroflexota bacterium]